MFNRADLRQLNMLGWILFAGLLVLAIHKSFQQSEKRDFVYFYSIGRILNEYSPEKLYRYALQRKVFEEVLPLKEVEYGPSPYPPYVAMFFRPFARLPYWTAYRLWTGITLILYSAGLWLLVKRFIGADRLGRSMFFCFGLSFGPFIAQILPSGQLSAVGFFAMALAICLEDSGRQYLSGLVLSVCLYKPTLLVLVVPMLLVIRRFKVLAGFGLGAIALATLTTYLEGPRIWLAYLRMSVDFARIRSFLPLPEYIDLEAFSTMIAHGIPFVRATVLCAGAVASVHLVRAWWLTGRAGERTPATTVWATTLTWTLLLNVYVPTYDSVLVVISVIASAPVFRHAAPRTFFVLGFLLLVFSYLTRPIASELGLQMLTLILAVFGALQLTFQYSELRQAAVAWAPVVKFAVSARSEQKI